jgi:Domain of unknown function (DUF222)
VEVAAAMNMSAMGASHVVAQAEAVDARPPAVGALLAEGRTDWRTVQVIIARTELVSSEVIGPLDQWLAERIGRWQCWSRRRIINAVDAAVRAIGPDAAKERRARADDDPHLSITARPDGTALGPRASWGVRGSPGAAVDTRLCQLATSVCTQDSRTIAQRRADALIALAEGRALGCDCGQSDCPTPAEQTAQLAGGPRTVINVIASADTVTGKGDQPGYLPGYGVIDAEHVRRLAATAALRPLQCPTVTAEEALRDQPSAALERWLRCRDLTCRFPGCDRPATHCDIDHTTPFNHANPAAGGVAVPWDLAC